MSAYQTPLYDAEKSDRENLENLYRGVALALDEINADGATKNDRVIYAGSLSSGTATVPLGTAQKRIFLAVIGGVPVLCACYNGNIAGRGGNQATTATLTATVRGETMTFSASATLDRLIEIF